jgi:hypothetical protein
MSAWFTFASPFGILTKAAGENLWVHTHFWFHST